ncbi:DUF559 domain-containing protein [Gordonia sp. (in: high G+C Gram-positive bacteria)]|jgi:very-short-patch-repair endonuclease|uniref:DUF559 domain-containing protein n=1 Tax=Gordonia sp. (in: high G+C Gram-positive bacteria) TaxID=84139 RepID=UPI001D707170|nr:DUF559 domain-containing protein [Gordonia sp. (in: high G+C Gram-positive bacteria)]MCB1293453.1 DUF559 domain-containing protein [Gordonia sp. (in: high G+C Gram-positive bacteria)]HMS77580.1 DUF559 domain-containing protein [Gordonia sp. (in: high G+C Gram-positive bacteria)]HQV20045.1 DUF559 domain-containing protein [Gordonia sp. (in: high G+C Gram-positive bacteria)]
MNSRTALAHGHGVVSFATLRSALAHAEIRRLISAGQLRPVRRGWYAAPWADKTVVAAVASGGVCSCVSALKLAGVWVPNIGRRTHARACGAAHRARPDNDFCRQYGRPEPEDQAVDGVDVALRHAVRCLDGEGIIVVVDSIINLGLAGRDEVAHLLRQCPAEVRNLVDKCDTAESGTETMVRCRLRAHNVKLTPQVWIRGIGRVDFLVGNRLIIEVDSEEFHHNVAQFHKDRERDRIAVEKGYLVVRLTYHDIVRDWAAAEESILEIVRRRDHLRHKLHR